MAPKVNPKTAQLIRDDFERSGRGDMVDLIQKALDEARWYDHIDEPERQAWWAIATLGLVLDDDAKELTIKPSAVRPEVQQQLAKFDTDIEQLERQIRALREQRLSCVQAAVYAALPEPKPDPSDLDFTETWDCDGSPTGHCAYNTAEDPTCDSCLFCGQPEERK